MIDVSKIVYPSGEQMMFVIEGMRNPMNSWDRSDSSFENVAYGSILHIGDNDKDLMKRLRKAGTDHRKFLRMMQVGMRITAPLYWWKEFDTYKVGTVSNSCSTMHKLTTRDLTLEDFSCDQLIQDINTQVMNMRDHLQNQINILNEWRKTYLDAKNSPNSVESAKKYWYQIIQLLPSSYNQTRNITLNYEVLLNMYYSRCHHKLKEWVDFCKIIKEMRYMELFIDDND